MQGTLTSFMTFSRQTARFTATFFAVNRATPVLNFNVLCFTGSVRDTCTEGRGIGVLSERFDGCRVSRFL
jgi:hypothetical protein